MHKAVQWLCVQGISSGLVLGRFSSRTAAKGRIGFDSVARQKTYLKSEATHAVLSLLV